MQYFSSYLYDPTSAVDGELWVLDDGVERLGEGVVEGRRADQRIGGVGCCQAVGVAVYCALK